MKIGLAFNLSIEILEFSTLFNSIELHLVNFFKEKDYGHSIKEIYIGVICLSPEFKKLRKQMIPKLNKTSGVFQYEFFIDYQKLKGASGEEALHLLTTGLLESCEILVQEANKFESFDIKKFKKDLKFFVDQCYIEKPKN